MAKSQIIKDLANSSIDTMTALKRAKVILSEFDNEDIMNWINCEIAGYPEDASLPNYRITQGHIVGSYFKGSMANCMVFENVSIPLGEMPDEYQEKILNIQFRESVNALNHLLNNSIKNNENIYQNIPADFFPAIAKYNNNPNMIITSAKVHIGSQIINDIFSIIENKLLDILILLEKEFGNLDKLDLDTTSKTPEELQTITDKIVVIIYNDNSVTIGNDNKIKNSSIASKIEKQ